MGVGSRAEQHSSRREARETRLVTPVQSDRERLGKSGPLVGRERTAPARAQHAPPDAVRFRGSLGTLSFIGGKRRSSNPLDDRHGRLRASSEQEHAGSHPGLSAWISAGAQGAFARAFSPPSTRATREDGVAEVPFPRLPWKLSHRACENAHPSQPRSDADARRPDHAGAIRDEGHRTPRTGEETPGRYRLQRCVLASPRPGSGAHGVSRLSRLEDSLPSPVRKVFSVRGGFTRATPRSDRTPRRKPPARSGGHPPGVYPRAPRRRRRSRRDARRRALSPRGPPPIVSRPYRVWFRPLGSSGTSGRNEVVSFFFHGALALLLKRVLPPSSHSLPPPSRPQLPPPRPSIRVSASSSPPPPTRRRRLTSRSSRGNRRSHFFMRRRPPPPPARA